MRLTRTRVLLSLKGLLAASAALAEPAWLEGQVSIINTEGQVQPPELAAKVRLQGTGASARTEPQQGSFRLQLPESVQTAGPLSLEVELPGYQVCVPAKVQVQGSGGALIPAVAVLLVEEDTRSQAECGRRVAVGIAEQLVSHWPRGLKPRPLKPASLVESWARLHDLSVERAQAVLEAWALQVKGSKGISEWEQALAALVTGNQAEAVRLAEGVARQGQERLGGVQQEQSRVLREIASAYNLQGAAHNASGEYARALEAYEQALPYIIRQEEPRLWAAAMSGAGFAHAALSRAQQDEKEHMGSAVRSYRQALATLSRARSPREWAAMQSVLGAALMSKTWKLGAEEGVPYLDEAIKVLRESLEVYTPSHTPQRWALSQAWLGWALQLKGKYLQGQVQDELLEESVVVLRSARELCTREEMPWECAVAYRNLGNALWLQAEKLQGDARLELLQGATEAFGEASRLYEREQIWDRWAEIQGGLGSVLTAQGKALAGEAGVKRLREAVDAYQRARDVYEREQMRDDWADVQLSLCLPLEELIRRLQGRAVQEPAEAGERAIRNALSVYTRERRPMHWVTAKSALAEMLMMKAKVLLTTSPDEESAAIAFQWLEEGKGAIQETLTVFTHGEYPEAWAAAQSTYCNMLLFQGFLVQDLSKVQRLAEEEHACREALRAAAVPPEPGEEARRALSLGVASYQGTSEAEWKDKEPQLKKAEALFRKALRGLVREQDPDSWGAAQIQLGLVLRERAEGAGKQEKLQLLEEAEGAFREALRVYTFEDYPEHWALAQHGLGHTLSARGPWLSGEGATSSLQEAVQRIRESLKVYTYEKKPQEWAAAQLNLGFTLVWLGTYLGGEAGVQTIREARNAYNEALRVFTPEKYPKEWARAKHSLTKVYRELLERAGINHTSPLPVRELNPPPWNNRTLSPSRATVSPSLRPTGSSPVDSAALSGVLYLMDDEGNKQVPSTPMTVRIRGYGQEAVASPGSGNFKLPLPETFKAGDPISLSVTLEGYELVEPPGGWLRLPDSLTETSVRIILQPGEPRRSFARNDALRMRNWLMEMNGSIMASERFAGLGPPALEAGTGWLSASQSDVDMSYEQAMLEYEARHGGDGRLILEALAQGKYEEAAARAEKAAREQARLLEEAEAEGRRNDAERSRGELVVLLQQQGQALESKFDFDGAIDVYTRALKHVSRERGAFSWARLHENLSFIYVVMAEMKHGAEARLLLEGALRHLEFALEALTRERLPEYWALAQLINGRALCVLGMMEGGETASQRLREAVAAYQRALSVWDAEQQPFFVAIVQHEIGQVLVLLGMRERGEEGVRHLKDAITYYTRALETFTRHRAPLYWAYIQATLGQANALLGSREAGGGQEQLLAEAQAAAHQALQFISIERDRTSWFMVQNNLHLELRERGMNSEGEEAVRLLRQAVEVCERMLQVIKPERERAYWLMVKVNLSGALVGLALPLLKQGKIEEGRKSLKSAEGVALEVLGAVDREHEPQAWLKARAALCGIHQALSLLDPRQGDMRLLEGAVGACREALQGITRQGEPEFWELLQRVQGETLVEFGRRLEALTRESLTQHPGEEALQVQLAESLLLQKKYSEGSALLDPLLSKLQADAHTAVRLRVLTIVALLAQGERGRVREELETLRALIASQPESFSGKGSGAPLGALLNHEEKLSPWREWLGELLKVLSARERAAMLAALDSCSEQYRAAGLSQ